MPTNQFKARLREGRTQIGLWTAMGDAYAAELVGHAGFDWLVIDAEHGPNDLRGILTFDEGLNRRYLELGATFVAVGADVTEFTAALRALAGRYGLGATQGAPRGY